MAAANYRPASSKGHQRVDVARQRQALTFARLAPRCAARAHYGAAGFVVNPPASPGAVGGWTAHDTVVEIDLLVDPARLRERDLTMLGD